MNTLKEIVPAILEWANEKGILNNPEVTPLDQMRKTQEEMGELWVEIIRDDRPKIINEIGDVFVTLVIQCEMSRIPLIYNLPKSPLLSGDSISLAMDRLGACTTEVWQCMRDEHQECLALEIHEALYSLNSVAAVYGISLEDCAYHALKKIQGRTGGIINGQFVKDQ